jgi:hypothetical protein
MFPQRIFGKDTYTPEGIAMMRQAFDIVWERIAPGVIKNGTVAARAKLADSIIAHADQAQSAEDLAENVMSVMFVAPIELGADLAGTPHHWSRGSASGSGAC